MPSSYLPLQESLVDGLALWLSNLSSAGLRVICQRQHSWHMTAHCLATKTATSFRQRHGVDTDNPHRGWHRMSGCTQLRGPPVDCCGSERTGEGDADL